MLFRAQPLVADKLLQAQQPRARSSQLPSPQRQPAAGFAQPPRQPQPPSRLLLGAAAEAEPLSPAEAAKAVVLGEFDEYLGDVDEQAEQEDEEGEEDVDDDEDDDEEVDEDEEDEEAGAPARPRRPGPGGPPALAPPPRHRRGGR
ncbi:nucleolin [Phymastichus coffea]|uniref:nucleolin n=1 Tax=Phymastichus coffea TaxID=108790 RepID=UPI00273BB32B|nr:nucleolin [Phymastichus coffea]